MPNNEFGDFQTPEELSEKCLSLLDIPENARILEPTCGLGSFLRAAMKKSANSERKGLDINPGYVSAASKYGDVKQGDIFQFNANAVKWNTSGPLFVIGNPPWVTSSDLRRMGSGNIPPKENFKHAKGYDALLGSSNFDVCEYVILKLLSELRAEPFVLGMLCKTQVARNIIEFAAKEKLPITKSAIYRIDAKKSFNASVDACWFIVYSSPSVESSYITDVYSELASEISLEKRFGMIHGQLVSDVDKYEDNSSGDGKCPYEWRSGLKHDASSVFELKNENGMAVSSFGDSFEPDGKFILPLLKSTDVFRGKPSSKWVIVPQLSFGGETETLHRENPVLWDYLDRHSDVIDGRKSSIYKDKARFTVFGHGDYTYSPYKIAISGLHKSLYFRLITPTNGVPIVLDDTCYFLPFSNSTEACLVISLLINKPCQDLMESLIFWDSKRPVNKKILSRINMFSVSFSRSEVLGRASEIAEKHGIDYGEGNAERILSRYEESIPTLF
ncbi:SAM-dependent DNA methyltransferase [Bifidobacterium longum]|uniref:SAM-dependent DNA methyltransferase n=1 Tax=Bifidobacterium longum TaxID=216816 RepID=UPI0019582D8F|nr:SAM-dependent DNA methyltransferase [Bifidobacterium longum]VTX85622.1 Uncharacterised protein [Bifidobacterium longum]